MPKAIEVDGPYHIMQDPSQLSFRAKSRNPADETKGQRCGILFDFAAFSLRMTK